MLFVTSNPSCSAVLPMSLLPAPRGVPSASCRSSEAHDRVMLRLTRSDAAQTRRAACAGQAHYPEISQSAPRTCRMLQESCPAEVILRGAGPRARAARQKISPGKSARFSAQILARSRLFAGRRKDPCILQSVSVYTRLTAVGVRRFPLRDPVAASCWATNSQAGQTRTAEKASGCIAQLVEQLTLNQPVLGSNPRAPTTSLPFLTSTRRTEPQRRLQDARIFAQD